MENLHFALKSAKPLIGTNPLDIPYISMVPGGPSEHVVDRYGRVLPQDWTGLCVTAVSTYDFWLIERNSGRRSAMRLGRFHSVADVVEHLQAEVGHHA